MTAKTRIVLTDDDVWFREEMAKMLSAQESLEIVAQADNGEEALLAFGKQPAEIAMLDIDMPVLDGVSAAEKIHNQYPDVKIIMMTSFEHNDSYRRSYAAGAHAFLTKDAPIEQFLSAIERILAGERLMEIRPQDVLREAHSNQKETPADQIPANTKLSARIKGAFSRLTGGN